MSSIMRRRSGLMVSSFIGVLPSRGEVGHPSILETGPLSRHPNPFSRSPPPPAEHAIPRATPPAKRVRSVTLFRHSDPGRLAAEALIGSSRVASCGYHHAMAKKSASNTALSRSFWRRRRLFEDNGAGGTPVSTSEHQMWSNGNRALRFDWWFYRIRARDLLSLATKDWSGLGFGSRRSLHRGVFALRLRDVWHHRLGRVSATRPFAAPAAGH